MIKEPIANKGPRLTTQISLPGRYVVMVPGSRNVGISKKISNISEKKRLRKIVSELKPQEIMSPMKKHFWNKTLNQMGKKYQMLANFPENPQMN